MSPDAVHERLLVLDTHLDTPVMFDRPGWSIRDRHSWRDDLSHVDLPRMDSGGLDGGWWVIFTPQGPVTAEGHAAALDHARKRLASIRRVVAENPDKMEIALTAADAPRIAAAGKRVVYISMENSAPLGEDLGLLSEFYAGGVRMVGIVHSSTNQFADSATGKRVWGGLSPLGKAWVKEMNRLGLVIDASHASDEAFDQMLKLSAAPIILSHSGPKSTYDHPRNLDAKRMKALAAKGGVMQINSVYLAKFNMTPARDALFDRMDARATMTPEDQRKIADDWALLDRSEALQDADFNDFMASMTSCLTVMGWEHCGVGADWDGGGGVAGLEDIDALPKITAALLKAGYSEGNISRIWGYNALRVMRAAEIRAGRR
jgi:membrane dipeptidase